MVSRDYRIRTDRDIKRVMKLGRKLAAPEFSVFVMPTTLLHPRIAVIAGATVSKHAVVRNRIKRQMRDVLRVALQTGRLQPGTDIIVLLRPSAARIEDKERRAFFCAALQRMRLL